MTNNLPTNYVTKAKLMLGALQTLGGEYLSEQRPSDAAKLYSAAGSLSVESLARLYDAITNASREG